MFAILKMFFVAGLVVFLIALFFVLSLVGNVIAMFRKAKNPQGNSSRRNTYTSSGSWSNTQDGGDAGYQQTTAPKKKIIPADEGEYVDYEEVK